VVVAGLDTALFDKLELVTPVCRPSTPCGDIKSGLPAIVALGDSHIFNVEPWLEKMAASMSRPFVSLSHKGCTFIPGTKMLRDGKLYEECSETIVNNAHQWLRKHPKSIVVYFNRLPIYLNKGNFFDNQEGGMEWEVRDGMHHFMQLKNGRSDSKSLGRAVQDMLGKLVDDGHVVVLVYPFPAAGWDVRKELRTRLENYPSSQRQKAFENDRLSTSYSLYLKWTAQARQVLDALGESDKIIRIYPDRLVCSSITGRCYTHNTHTLYYIDDDHPSSYIGKRIANRIGMALAETPAISRPYLFTSSAITSSAITSSVTHGRP
jgi:hypothetical protein